MRYATISLALAAAAAVVPSLALSIQAREDLELDLYAREVHEALFARGKNGGGPRPRPIGSGPNKPPKRREQTYDLWERMDIDELE
ncbi:hypothetical protein FOMPIDRAFT_1053996 [Fomitopsis schrenkii]|uniref:Uncharacterized protein n=1 Tax=Fomitopsis schrenkii TaxID=2126942 RepID=S8DWT3_FOMSC|nr:hypothetical protein FOMPIDRAFT_1053996 [Fomitopsis schrenkii]